MCVHAHIVCHRVICFALWVCTHCQLAHTSSQVCCSVLQCVLVCCSLSHIVSCHLFRTLCANVSLHTLSVSLHTLPKSHVCLVGHVSLSHTKCASCEKVCLMWQRTLCVTTRQSVPHVTHFVCDNETDKVCLMWHTLSVCLMWHTLSVCLMWHTLCHNETSGPCLIVTHKVCLMWDVSVSYVAPKSHQSIHAQNGCTQNMYAYLIWYGFATINGLLKIIGLFCKRALQKRRYSAKGICNLIDVRKTCMGWLRLVGSFKLQISFAEYRLFYRALLQKRPTILSILLIEATP